MKFKPNQPLKVIQVKKVKTQHDSEDLRENYMSIKEPKSEAKIEMDTRSLTYLGKT